MQAIKHVIFKTANKLFKFEINKIIFLTSIEQIGMCGFINNAEHGNNELIADALFCRLKKFDRIKRIDF